MFSTFRKSVARLPGTVFNSAVHYYKKKIDPNVTRIKFIVSSEAFYERDGYEKSVKSVVNAI